MALNLVTLISQFLTPDMIATISRALGLDSSVAGKALGAAVPGLLGSLVGAASSQDGARKVFDAATSQSSGTREDLASALNGSGKDTFIKNGSSMLSSLLGGSAAPALAGALGRYAGMGQGAGTSLLGLLAPIVLGALGKESMASGLDASGLSRLLASQKDNIAAALPAGFADALRAAGLPGFSGVAAPDAQAAARAARSNVAQAASVSKPKMPATAWIIPLIAVAAIAWWMLGRTPATDEAANSTAQPVQGLSVDEGNAQSTLQATLGSVKNTLQGVTDTGSAEVALPKLQDATMQLDKLNGLKAQLPANGKTALAAAVAAARPSLEEQFNRVLALPGVAAIAQPMIEQFRGKLDSLA